MRRALLLAACSMIACKSSDAPTSKQAPTASGPAVKDLPSQPRSPVAITLGGYPALIDLPPLGDWRQPPKVEDRRVTWELGRGLPRVSVSIGDTLGPAWQGRRLGSQTPLATSIATLVRADTQPDGSAVWLEKVEDRSYFHLELCRPVPMGATCCSVTHHDHDKQAVDAFDTLVAWAEQVCGTLRLKG